MGNDHLVISRFLIACPGCSDGIRLRISIGHEERQDFYALCPHCNAALHGSLLTDQAHGEVLDLSIDGRPAEYVESAEANVNVFTDLPVDPTPTSMEQPGGSPFIMHYQLLGEPFIGWERNVGLFHGVIDNDWAEIKRWFGYYVRRDWQHFDDHARRLFDHKWPNDPSLLARHDAIHRALDLIFLPLLPSGAYVSWRVQLAFREEFRANWPNVLSFVEELSSATDAARVQQDLFDVLDQFVMLRWKLLPNMLIDLYKRTGVEYDPNWRVMRDDFRELRDLHNSIFETSYAVLPIVMAFVNVLVHGDSETFPAGSSYGLRRVTRFKAVQKEELLRQYTPWGVEIADLLDRQLRNAVGHSDARNDLVTGQIVTPRESISYLDFANRTGQGVHVILLCLSIIKYLVILGDSES